MKKLTFLTAATAALLTASACAGETYQATGKTIAPPVPAPVYGTGFYLGFQAGANFYQDFGGSQRFDLGFGNELTFDPSEKIGFVGGLKAGYVFGTGTVRPAIEADLFYNGVRGDLDARLNGNDLDFNADANLNSGAFLANFLVRFCFDRFQPYLGAGVGGYYSESSDVDITVLGTDFSAEGGDSSGLAWQLIGGADYYFAEKMSVFAEYKFLNYEDAGISSDRIGQHIGVVGMRFHF